MKNSRLLYVFMSTLLLLSCEDELLNVDPVSSITTANYYRQPSDFEEAIIGVYDRFQVFADQNYLNFTEIRSDNVIGLKQASQEAISGDQTSLLASEVTNSLWTNLYQIISLSNAILDRIEAVDFSDATAKARITGEARFFRGLSHYYLGKFFGEAVVLTSEIDLDAAQAISSLDPQSALFSQAEADLTASAGLLPTTTNAFGRVTQYIAEGFVADYYVFTGNHRAAEPFLESVLQNSGAVFDPDFTNIFSADETPEVIFAAVYVAGGEEASSYPFNLVTIRGGLIDGNFNYTQGIIDHFDNRGDMIRKGATLQTGDWVNLAGEQVTGEHRNIKLEQGMVGTERISTGDLVMLRYTDMYLQYAEVLLETGGTPINGWTPLSIINDVRNRAGLALLASVTIQDILDERRSEFVWEGQRWWDQVRRPELSLDGVSATYPVPDLELSRMGLD